MVFQYCLFDPYCVEGEDYERLNKIVEIPVNETRVDINLTIFENNNGTERCFEEIEIRMDVVDPCPSDKIAVLKDWSIATIHDKNG